MPRRRPATRWLHWTGFALTAGVFGAGFLGLSAKSWAGAAVGFLGGIMYALAIPFID